MTPPAEIHIHPLARRIAGLSLVATPAAFVVLVWGVFAVGLVATFARFVPGPNRLLNRLPPRARRVLRADWSPTVWQALLLVTARLPCLAFPFELQQDESQFASQAISLLHDPVFYRAVDGGSAGPLDSHVLWLPRLLGQEIDFFTVRCVGLLLWWLGVVAVHRAVLGIAGPLPAAAASWSATACYALACQLDFMSYQSEVLPAAIAAWGCFAVLRLIGPAATAHRRTALALGLACGSLPLAKLQAAPVGLALAAIGYVAILRRDHADRDASRQAATPESGSRWRLAGWLTLGGLLVPAFFGAVFVRAGVCERFVRMYLLAGASYTTLTPPEERLFSRYPRLPLAEREPGWECLVAAVALAAIAGGVAYIARRRWPARTRGMQLLVAATVTAAAFAAAAAPGRCYVHYLTLTILPLCLLLGLLLGLLPGRFSGLFIGRPANTAPAGTGGGTADHAPAIVWVIILAAVVCGPALAWTCQRPTPLRIVANGALTDDPRDTFPALRPLLALARPGDRLAVWGWQSSFHVYAQLPQGWPGFSAAFMRVPRETLSPLQRSMVGIDPELRVYLERETLADFHRHRPAFVIDAAGANAAVFSDRDRFGLHAWPAFARVVNADYRLVFSSPVDRLYLRADLVPARLPAGAPTPAAPGR